MLACLERADLLALLCVMFPRDFVTFTYGVSDHDLLWLSKAIASHYGKCSKISNTFFFSLFKSLINVGFQVWNSQMPNRVANMEYLDQKASSEAF